VFYNEACHLIWGYGSEPPSIQVIREPGFVKDTFMEPQYHAYTPLSVGQHLTPQILAKLSIPPDLDSFLKLIGLPTLSLTPEQYQACLYPSVLNGCWGGHNDHYREMIAFKVA